MAGMSDMPMRPARPGPPMQHRGPPPMARRPEPIDREKVSAPSLLLQMSLLQWSCACRSRWILIRSSAALVRFLHQGNMNADLIAHTDNKFFLFGADLPTPASSIHQGKHAYLLVSGPI